MVESNTGNRKKGDSRLNEQMAAHEGLVQWVVRQQGRGELAYEDARHAGRIGLWHALRGYDPSRGNRFSTYAVPAITRAVWEAVGRRAQEDRRRESTFPIAGSRVLDLTERVDRAQRALALQESVARLPARLHQVVVAHYGLDGRVPQSFAGIGMLLGVSRQRVQQLHVRALLWLAHPDHSRPLRHLLERQQRGDYQQALARGRQHARALRSARRSRR